MFLPDPPQSSGSERDGGRELSSPPGRSSSPLSERQTVYRVEKAIGLRSSAGRLKLRKLRTRHYLMIDLHMLGLRNTEIAEQLRVTPAAVCSVLADDLAKREIQQRIDQQRARLNPMLTKALDVVTDGMEAVLQDGARPNHRVRLKAADMVLKMRGEYEQNTKAEESAEDVVARIMNLDVSVRSGDTETRISLGQGEKHG